MQTYIPAEGGRGVEVEEEGGGRSLVDGDGAREKG